MSARKTYTAAEARRVDQLRAEARAWRRAAEDVRDYVCLATPLANGLRVRMTVRFRTHFELLDDSGGPELITSGLALSGRFARRGFGADDNARVLACLFLALECEDEARALGRGGQ